MATFNTSMNSPLDADATMLAIQEGVKQFEWAVMEITANSMMVKITPKFSLTGYSYASKLNITIDEKGDKASLSFSATTPGIGPVARRTLEGYVGQLVNFLSVASKNGSRLSGGPATITEELSRLSDLLDKGVLSPEEFQIIKKRLIGD